MYETLKGQKWNIGYRRNYKAPKTVKTYKIVYVNKHVSQFRVYGVY